MKHIDKALNKAIRTHNKGEAKREHNRQVKEFALHFKALKEGF